MAPSHSNKRKTGTSRRSSLVIISTMIILLSTWSIICSHLLIGETINTGSLHLLSPNKLESQKADASNNSPDILSNQPQNTNTNNEQQSTTSNTPIPNSQLYNPPTPTNTTRRLLTYTRHGGRLNNQLIQFIGALQHSVVLKRTLVVPDEKVAVEWTGLLDDSFEIWDLSGLKAKYEIDWISGLGEGMSVKRECVLNKKTLGDLLNRGVDHWREWDKKCPDIISLGHELPLCSPKHSFCGDSEALNEAYKIYPHLKLSPFMTSLLPPPQPLSVHSRRAGEGGYDVEICTDPTRRICHEHINPTDRERYCNERTLRGNCAIWTDLHYAIKSKRIWKENERQYRFNLASDGTHDWSIDYNGQFVMANSTPWLEHMDQVVLNHLNKKQTLQSLGQSHFIRERLKNERDLLSKSQGIMFQLSSTILEMFSLVNSDYFVGGYYSTLSLNVCLLRGLDRNNDSNMCWMLIHPNSQYAIPPPVEDTVNIPDNNDMEEMPPALMSDLEHAFVTSSDGKFFVIDRYRFMYGKPRSRERIPTFIAVMGQGEVPMTVEKQSSGEDKIRGNFTCSMGEQKNSNTSIYILKDDEGSTKNEPQTLFIVCDDLKYDNDVTIQPPLILQSSDGSFSVQIGSKLVHTRNVPRRSADGSMPTYSVVNCLLPTDEEIDSGWLQSYLKHYSNLGVKNHLHIYNVNWHSPKLQSILNDYRTQRRLISRHDWSKRAKSRSTNNNFSVSLARPAAKMDCMMRGRGVDGYAFFGDIRETIDKTNASKALKSCMDNSRERCVIDVDVAPLELIKGDLDPSHVSNIKHEKRGCVNMKSVELAPWDLVNMG